MHVYMIYPYGEVADCCGSMAMEKVESVACTCFGGSGAGRCFRWYAGERFDGRRNREGCGEGAVSDIQVRDVEGVNCKSAGC